MKHMWPIAALLASACGGSDDPAGPPFGIEQRTVVQGLTFPTGYPDPRPLVPVDAFPSLSFSNPVVVTHAGDGSDRLFVAQVGGIIRVFPNDAATLTSQVFLDISGSVINGSERGLLGLAFDPDYTSNGFFYVYYSTTTATSGQDHRSVVSRFQVTGDPNVANAGSETVLLTFDQPYGNHNAGCLAFGPDGMLYISTGDGGSANDPQRNAQDRTTLLGKMLRLAPDGSIPADNPFVGVGGGVREEIWAYGLRNPFRFSFDRGTGDLWAGDVGQGAIEEIDIITRGGNYGWVLFEGTRENINPNGVPFSSTIGPVHEYDRGGGFSITGGVVYRGALNTSIVGTYIYGDYVTGRIWALVYDGSQVISNVEVTSVTNPTSFGEDEAGELYVTSYDGNIYRFDEAPGGPRPPFPQLLSETGLFTDTPGLTPTPGLVEYDVNVELWTDGALKRRWLALPGQAGMIFDATNAWGFPGETVVVKHFEIETEPGVIRRLETRVLINEGTGWQGYTYKWNAQQDDADLLPGGDTDVITIADPNVPGGQYDLTWNYPSRAECLACHTAAAGRVLGLRTRQINRDHQFELIVDNQLRAWNHVDFFTVNIGQHGSYPTFPLLDDGSADATDRARAYMDVNCAHCHQPGSSAPTAIDLRYATLAAQMNAVGVAPTAGDVGLTNPYIVAPGIKELSVLWERMRVLDGNRMPNIGTGTVHAEAVDIVGEWIDDGAN